MQSGSDAFAKSRFIMTCLTILGVTELLCSFKLVLALSDAGENTCKPLSRGGIGGLPLLRTLLAIHRDKNGCIFHLGKHSWGVWWHTVSASTMAI